MAFLQSNPDKMDITDICTTVHEHDFLPIYFPFWFLFFSFSFFPYPGEWLVGMLECGQPHSNESIYGRTFEHAQTWTATFSQVYIYLNIDSIRKPVHYLIDLNCLRWLKSLHCLLHWADFRILQMKSYLSN